MPPKLSNLEMFMRIILSLVTLLLLTSCHSYKIVEGNFGSGIKIRESANIGSPIIFGRVKVYDNSETLSSDKVDIADSCIVFIDNNPLFGGSMFYKYNWPNTGEKSNIYKGLFAIQSSEEDFKNKKLNLACGTGYYAKKRSKIFWSHIVEYDSYLRIDLAKLIKIKSDSGKAWYLGDIEISIPNNAIISDADRSFAEGIIGDFIGDYYRDNIKTKINFSARITDNYAKTSKDIVKVIPFIKENFVFDIAIAY